ncbi:helix-turn-helix domain protein [Pseudogulbenkiania sp. NH8B]|uniref:hypothetical protein n=1 Tax=Pseudogulbenkiania sp. (strain NH8B) TaxID=748280 RepID=UPI0002279D94|nr:hypothetical protein [Pseudogulbenkiania sp. NH8B]BAK77084.1 helix-turn-helix domain protein [Pseudogulbenkiania sp. NH8B]
MKTFADYVEQIKEKHGVTSTYAVAKMLGVSQGNMSNMIHERSNVPNLIRCRVADLLEIDPTEVIASLEWQREDKEEVRDYWKSVFFRHCRAASMAGLVAAMLSGVPVDAKAGGVGDITNSLHNPRLCELVYP